MSQQPQMQIQLQTYIIVATTNDNRYANYELYRRSRSFTISLFVLHCTPLYHIDPDHEVNPHHLSCERTRLPICLKTCIYIIQHIVIIIRLHPRQIDANYELYRSSGSFTISLFVLHCTPLYHFDAP